MIIQRLFLILTLIYYYFETTHEIGSEIIFLYL